MNTAWSVLESGRVYEDVMASYVMLNLDAELFGLPLTGNLGVRRVTTDQSATNLSDVGGDPLRGAQNLVDETGLVNTRYAFDIVGDKYTKHLPSINLNLALTDEWQLRMAAAKVMSRPPINRLASVTSFSISDTGEITGNSANSPFLRPFEANQYDLSLEYYFGSGALAMALFYKDIQSFIQDDVLPEFDFKGAGFPVPDFIIPDPESGVPVATRNGSLYTAVNNSNGGYIRGAEVAYTQVFKSLPSYLSGLGAQLSYSYTESEVSLINSLGGEPIETTFEGLSKNVVNATLFWEYEGIDTRINGRYRSPFVSTQVGVNEQITNFASELVLDFQFGYQFNDNLKMLFQVNNLTDEPTRSYFGQEEMTGTLQFFGRQYFLGAVYSF